MTGKAAAPRRGEIWIVDFDPTRGHEQSGKRPALALSATQFNQGPAGLVVVLPITSKDKRIPWHVRLAPPEGGLTRVSFVKCDDIRSVSVERLGRQVGVVSAATMLEIEDRLRILLEI